MNDNGAAYAGAIYGGAAMDGPASWFVFGSSDSYDAQRHFDTRFGMNYDQAFPAAGVAVFRFESLNLDALPTFNTKNGVLDVALVGDTKIGSSADTPSFTWNLDNLRSLTLATTDGSLEIAAPQFTATAGSQFEFLQLYQRGDGGSVKLASLSLPTASLYVDASGRISLGGSDVVTADRIVLHTDANIDIVGAVNANFLQLYAGTSIDFKKKLSLAGTLFAYAETLTSQQDLSVTAGALEIGSGGIDLNGVYTLTGFDNISTWGDLHAGDISVQNKLFVGGNLSTKNDRLTLTAFTIEMPNGVAFDGRGRNEAFTLTLNVASLVIGAGGINGINLDGGDAELLALDLSGDELLAANDGGDGGTLNVGTAAAPVAGDVTINAPVSATSGANGSQLTTGGKGGTINVNANGTVAVNSTIKVSDKTGARKSSRGGDINLTSNKTSGTAISVSSSAQLLSLLDDAAPGPGGTIKFASAGGAVNIRGKVQADRGTIDVRNSGASGVVTLENATLNASTVKVSALGANGTLNVGGGTISADSIINLYAGGSNGTVKFTDNVTLSGNSVKTISGNTVTIVNGKVVTISGPAPASVFTNNANYTGSGGNGSTTGTFGGKGATTSPLSAGPGPGG